MIASHDLLTDSGERPLKLRARRDLVCNRQTYLGRNYWVVKDPLTLEFYRFEEEEYSILQLLNGTRSPAEIRRQFEQQFAPQQLALPELQVLVSRLYRQSLVVADAAEQGEQLLQREQQRQSTRRRAAWTNILCVRFPGVNPDRFLTWLNARCGWMFSRPGAIAALLLVVSALLLIAAQFDVFLNRLPGFHAFFAGENWILLALVLAGTKVLHELGHGMACKRFGGECHDMGFMLLVLTPCLYCNVSDSWMVRSKWGRAAIGAAGMYVEVVLASICTFLWWFSDVGLLHYLCLDIMFVCSVSTLLFNANPLLRYDGYFILSDVLEIPNLRQKSGALVQRMLGKWCLGIEPNADPFLPHRRRWLFAGYAVAATIYRWFIVFSILWFLYHLMEPYGLKSLGQLMTIVVLYGLVAMPLRQFARFLSTAGRVRQLKTFRLLASAGLSAGLLAALVLVPLPHRVRCDFQLQTRDATTVYVDVPGQLVEIHVQPGQAVRAGQILAVLENEEITMALTQLRGQRDHLVAKLEALQLQSYDQEEALLEMSSVSESIASLDRRIGRRSQDLERLTIRASCDGHVFAVADRPRSQQPETLPTWTGHPLEPRNLSAQLDEGTPLCQIGCPDRLEAILAIDESTIQAVRSGQSVELFPDQLRGQKLNGQVAQIAQTNRRVTAASFASDDVAPASRERLADPSGIQPSQSYHANVPLETDHRLLLAGGRGRAKIDTGTRTVGQSLWDSLCRTFHFEL